MWDPKRLLANRTHPVAAPSERDVRDPAARPVCHTPIPATVPAWQQRKWKNEERRAKRQAREADPRLKGPKRREFATAKAWRAARAAFRRQRVQQQALAQLDHLAHRAVSPNPRVVGKVDRQTKTSQDVEQLRMHRVIIAAAPRVGMKRLNPPHWDVIGRVARVLNVPIPRTKPEGVALVEQFLQTGITVAVVPFLSPMRERGESR